MLGYCPFSKRSGNYTFTFSQELELKKDTVSFLCSHLNLFVNQLFKTATCGN